MAILKCVFLLICFVYVSADPPTQEDVTRLHTDMLGGYDKDILPLKTFNKPVEVEVSVRVVSINDFDDISGELAMTVSLNFSWVEERIQWDMGNYSNISSIIVPYGRIWTPQIFLVNAVNKIVEIGHESIMIRVASDGRAIWSPGQILKSTCAVSVQYYPFDTQTCSMMFVAWSYIASEVQLKDQSEKLDLSFYTSNSQWKFLESSLTVSSFEGRQILNYQFVLKRRSELFLVYIISPIVMLGVLNNLVFAMPVTSGERSSVAITSFLSFAVYMGIINDKVPDNSAPVATIFYYLLFLMIHSTMTMILTVISLRTHEKEGPVYKPIKVLVNLFRLHYCRATWGKRRVGLSEKELSSEKAKSDVYGAKQSKINTASNSDTITWKVVGNTFDGVLFVFSILMHASVSFGFIYSIYMNNFPEIETEL